MSSPSSDWTTLDRRHMQAALDLAQQARPLCPPNPAVGCVIVGNDGLVAGHTQATGGPHAEAMALQQAAVQGVNLQGATAYVTLEPCSHFGRTPPCADALISARLARVVVALGDPHPNVAGQGIARLRAAGIRVDLLSPQDPLALQAREINLGFLSRIVRKRPWVRLKVAASLDGLTALPDGQSQWITGPQARADGHLFRARSGAVLTGIGTVRADDPLLTARGVDAPRQPLRVVVDSSLAIPDQARLLKTAHDVRIYTARPAPQRLASLRQRGVKVIEQANVHGQVDLAAMLTDLATAAEVNELHVEAGATLNGALVRGGLVDEYLVYVAPCLLGQGRGMWELGPLPDLAAAPRLQWREVLQVGDDLRLLAREAQREQF